MAGSSAHVAAVKVREKALLVASHLLKSMPPISTSTAIMSWSKAPPI